MHTPQQMMGMGGGRSSASAREMQQNLLMAQQSLLRGAPNMLGGRAPVNTPPNVVMGYPMGATERSSKDSHHSPSTAMSQQVILISAIALNFFDYCFVTL
jgi:hypothetical protein